ncbi:MAG TPA: UDP-glucose/GDP-mannose dehydrogenase family protein, partial [Thermoanaerobaculia bacterium]|nr:UDP-glucose/GDP-mannose dehydrogenase family protein [Thermoanaerobaculia bacterium]
MQICVVGTGYVGLVTGACLADFGMEVTCVDKVAQKIEMLQRGEMPIYEPGLEALVQRNVEAGRLHFTTDLPSAVEPAVAVFIAVGTPPREDGSADLSYVVQVAEAIAEHMQGYKVVVTKSTVPVGTGALIEKILREKTGGRVPFSVVSNPEFLREGSAIEDFMNPDRVVIGAREQRAVEIMREVYSPLETLEVPFVVTNVETSELIKYASNAFLATKITFINEVAALCERLGADVAQVSRGMGLDQRIGPAFLHPGPGYGGSCFPKDTSALVDIAAQAGMRFEIVETVVAVNDRIKQRAAQKVLDAVGDVRGRTIGVLGL